MILNFLIVTTELEKSLIDGTFFNIEYGVKIVIYSSKFINLSNANARLDNILGKTLASSNGS